jgi:hypothetical protein
MRRRQFLATALVALAAPSTQAADAHWLLGTWEGGRRNVGSNSRTGGERMLIVRSVTSDGTTAKGTWVVSTANVTVTLSIAGDKVTFTTPGAQGITYRLEHKGDMLEGDWTTQATGRVGTVELKKK